MISKRRVLLEKNKPLYKEFIYSKFYKKKFFIYSEDEESFQVIREDKLIIWPTNAKEAHSLFNPWFHAEGERYYAKLLKETLFKGDYDKYWTRR